MNLQHLRNQEELSWKNAKYYRRVFERIRYNSDWNLTIAPATGLPYLRYDFVDKEGFTSKAMLYTSWNDEGFENIKVTAMVHSEKDGVLWQNTGTFLHTAEMLDQLDAKRKEFSKR